MLLDADGVTGTVAGASIDELVERAGPVSVIGIDMPIGLSVHGPRPADVAARAALGSRRSTVFLTPVRAAVSAPTYEEANAIARRLTGAGLSRQAYGLASKILEVDRWMAGHVEGPVHEVHPELSFSVLSGRTLTSSKKRWSGFWERRQLLDGAGVHVPPDIGGAGGGAGTDDVLDAAVVAWSARRIAAGQARSYPDPPAVDDAGRPMAVWA